MSRNNKYLTHVQPRLKEVSEMYQFATETQIAKMLGISLRSFENYKAKYPELKEALNAGKQALIVELKSALKKKALGFEYKEQKRQITEVDGERRVVIEEYTRYAQPDTGAIHLLLKNLDPEWRNDDKTTVDLKREKLRMEQEKQENNNWT